MKYLKLLRIQNLLLLAFMQVLFRYTFLKTATFTTLTTSKNFLALSHFQFFLLVLATVCIAAAGYVINDILDQETDEIAKKRIVGKSISESTAYNLYVALNLIGVGSGFYISNVIQKPSFAALFIFTAAILYVYATWLKQIAIVGNIVVALVLSFSILILGIFDLVPSTHEGNEIWEGNKVQMRRVFSILTDYAIFAFIINFLRELVKDIEVSIQKMMDMDVEELSDDNKHLFEMKILGLRTIHQFLGALQQENYLKEYKAGLTTELKGQVNIDVNERLDGLTQGTVH